MNYGLNKVRFPSPVPVGSQLRATVTVMSAQQKTSGIESVFDADLRDRRRRAPGVHR